MNVLAIGASKNIGYHASLRLLAANCNVTFMLRSPSVFDSDETIQSYVQSGKAHILKGDALVKDDVKRAWDAALIYGAVDVLLFTVGGAPSFSLTQGFVIKPHNLVTQSLLNVLCTMPKDSNMPTKVIVVSTTGLTKSSHATLPLPIKLLYSLIAVPHRDKVGVERIVSHTAGWKRDSMHLSEPKDDVMGERWTEREGLPAPGTLKNMLVIRPALLTDGECRAENKEGNPGYKVAEKDFKIWTVSRKDVGHFIADAVLNKWSEFVGKAVTISY